MRAHVRVITGILLFVAAAASSAAEIVVVVSSRSALTALRQDQVAAIFLGQEARLPDGSEAVPIDQPIDSPLREQFYLKVTGKTRALLKAYWSKMVFTGRGQPPREAHDSMAVLKAVADNPSVIGYIERDALDGSVRPVLVIH